MKNDELTYIGKDEYEKLSFKFNISILTLGLIDL